MGEKWGSGDAAVGEMLWRSWPATPFLLASTSPCMRDLCRRGKRSSSVSPPFALLFLSYKYYISIKVCVLGFHLGLEIGRII